MHLTIKEALEVYRNGCKAKCEMPTGRIIGKSVLAGMMIAMGAAASSVAAHSITNVGLSRLAASVVFPVGLMMVILLGAELFTGDCLLAIGLPEREITPLQFVRMLAMVFFGNLLGGVLLSVLISMSGQLDYSGGLLGAYTIKVALGKAMLTPAKAVTSGILCNILVCAAVLMALCAKDVAGKLLVSFFVIMLFVTAGFEHCVANMYYITAGILAKYNPLYAAQALESFGIGADQLELLNVKNMIINNLIPVTIGNIIGGVCFVGLPLYYLNSDKAAVKNVEAEKEETKNGSYFGKYVRGLVR